MAPPRFRKQPPKKAQPQQKAPARPMAQGQPQAVAPSSMRTTTSAQRRRGFTDERRELVRVVRPAVIATGAAVGVYTVGQAGREIASGVAQAREAGKPTVDLVPTPYDTNGDGAPDGVIPTPFVRNPDGSYDAYGPSPSHSKTPPKGTPEQLGDLAKTVGLVLVGVLVVGGVVYVVANPAVAQKLAKAVKG